MQEFLVEGNNNYGLNANFFSDVFAVQYVSNSTVHDIRTVNGYSFIC